MKKLALGVIGVALLASAAAFTTFGGWAVVKVSKIPDAWVVGKPLQLQWEAWQHGNAPLHGLKPTLEARSGARVIQGTTWEFEEDGVKAYRGRIAFPATGDKASGFDAYLTKPIDPFHLVDEIARIALAATA